MKVNQLFSMPRISPTDHKWGSLALKGKVNEQMKLYDRLCLIKCTTRCRFAVHLECNHG